MVLGSIFNSFPYTAYSQKCRTCFFIRAQTMLYTNMVGVIAYMWLYT
ncbi:hypothetical protein ACVPOY_04650 [Staphylococcus aureus]